ncbi:MAG: CCA tRNA nucleotidyltransferase [Symploca sp. SIO1C4]|uniref:CCA tRNA nucleotidyltransferase n=1 Tax=Symploca sp. SIO1C4 TaxID=2607765 RepID=A0A6B3NIL1_9CYAN|nr:CCA tRNA nucleotidyltransferase [Symploca sp. SIO1C4]
MNINLASSALSPETWPFSPELLPPEACLVGGAVRNALLGRQAEYLDLDFIVPTEAVKIGRRLAKKYKAGFVVLDAERQIARVVFKQATVDLALQEGNSLENDLNRRDFTINAIAYNPYKKQFIDPLQGVADLQARLMRMVSVENLQDDPLRLLRAYRQAAQLNFTIEANTKSVMPLLAPLLARVAVERIRTELSYLLKSPQGTPWLQAAWEDKLLQVCFPDAKAVDLSKFITIDHCAIAITQTWPRLGVELQAPVTNQLTSLLSLGKLASLLPSFPEAAESQLLNLKYARAEIKAIVTALKNLPQLLSHGTSEMSLREQYFFFQDVGSFFPLLAVMAIAEGISMDAMAPMINRYLSSDDQVAHPQPLVTGKDLMQALNLPASRQVGEILTEIQIGRIEGKFDSREAALEFAKQVISNK